MPKGIYARPTRETRFAKAVTKTDSCWLFGGSLCDGYGQITIDGIPYRAHRLAWELLHGEIPEGMFVCHSCDVRNCVNPDHLFLGTASENNQDKVRKGRGTRGEKCSLSRITEVEVLRIRALRNDGMTIPCLAKQFGMSLAGVHSVISRKTWKHL